MADALISASMQPLWEAAVSSVVMLELLAICALHESWPISESHLRDLRSLGIKHILPRNSGSKYKTIYFFFFRKVEINAVFGTLKSSKHTLYYNSSFPKLLSSAVEVTIGTKRKYTYWKPVFISFECISLFCSKN